jgi:alkylhydroperoxidase family enzyme
VTAPDRSERRALVAAVTTGAGRLQPDLRVAIVDRARGMPVATPVPQGLLRLVDLVARDAPAITDADVKELAAAGFDDEAAFEAIVASALGASLARVERVDELFGKED